MDDTKAMARQRILVISFAFYPYEGGAEIALREICNHSKGYDFDIITNRFSRKDASYERTHNMYIHRVNTFSRYLFPFVAAWKGHMLSRKKKPILVWSIMANYAGFAALFYSWFYPRVPFFLTMQEGDPIKHIMRRTRFVAPLFRQIFKRAHTISAISKYLSNFAESFSVRRKPVVIPNGINTEQFKEVNVLWPRHSKKNKVLVTTSRLVWKNAVDDIIRALSMLSHEYELLILGDGEMKDELVALAVECGVSQRVKFMGNVPFAHIPEHLSKADIFVRPSRSEGLGNSFLEAQAAGLPVIATNVGGIPDIVAHKKTGFLCEPNNPKSILNAVHYIGDRDNIEEVRRILKTARSRVFDEYTWEHIAQRYQEIFKKLS